MILYIFFTMSFSSPHNSLTKKSWICRYEMIYLEFPWKLLLFLSVHQCLRLVININSGSNFSFSLFCQRICNFLIWVMMMVLFVENTENEKKLYWRILMANSYGELCLSVFSLNHLLSFTCFYRFFNFF